MEPPREKFHSAHHASVHGAGGANGVLGTLPAQAYRRMFEMAGLRARPREGDTSAVQDVRKEILGSAWALRNTCSACLRWGNKGNIWVWHHWLPSLPLGHHYSNPSPRAST